METLFKSIIEKIIFYTLFVLMFGFTAIFKSFYIAFQTLYNFFSALSKKECCSKKKDLVTPSVT